MQTPEMTSLFREIIILMLMLRIIPVILDKSSEESNGRWSRFFNTRNDRVVFQPDLRSGCDQVLKRLRRKILRREDRIQFPKMDAFHVRDLDCNQQHCNNEPVEELCALNQEDGTKLKIFNNSCHKCAEGCEQVKNRRRPFVEVKDATIFNGNCYNDPPVMVRKKPDTTLCSRSESVEDCRINYSDIQDLPHLANLPTLPNLPNFNCADIHPNRGR